MVRAVQLCFDHCLTQDAAAIGIFVILVVFKNDLVHRQLPSSPLLTLRTARFVLSTVAANFPKHFWEQVLVFIMGQHDNEKDGEEQLLVPDGQSCSVLFCSMSDTSRS